MASKRDDASRVMVVMTTVGTEEQAAEIARHVVGRGLAACVNIVPGVRSIYRWKGEVSDDREHLLIVKTARAGFAALAAAIREKHPYELPELVGVDAALVEPTYAAWVLESSAGASPEQNRS
ncbi:MAG TPA: divalent-cation tolerance protein CutA [Candidatus Bathyarchaeia archaeon]|nr:divalent-cation tolerance protein CutA [Candidatus Bathyarchaeia archaeon]